MATLDILLKDCAPEPTAKGEYLQALPRVSKTIAEAKKGVCYVYVYAIWISIYIYIYIYICIYMYMHMCMFLCMNV